MGIALKVKSPHNLDRTPSLTHHPRCAKLGITHLNFEDNLLLFGKGDLDAVTSIQQVFNRFSASSGLQENLHKSSAFLFSFFGGEGLICC